MNDTTAASAAAWEAFCESLKKASAVLTRADMPADSRHAGIGARYLGGLLDSALGLYLHAADPDRPFLFTYFDNHRGWGLANPDGHYLRARGCVVTPPTACGASAAPSRTSVSS